ncbi:hypothetical protein A9995_11405 [Erythrobacter sp. QSSC1-22B]|uniref:major capsid protein n=1 Tax=Erythrobacter sp. QSSC1-22B TaxID=1860125 RepID=UPI000804E8F1|nr:hypothetical protein [Erythrobacter sp. QSSC1-22B]OBX18566.1 hypothetical protein A9995_11405 [Erythrobacter sp. QSSC1-22B]
MLTQTEWAKLNPDPLQSGVVEIFASTNPIMQAMPFQNIAGAAYVYNREQTLPGIAFRGINESYTASTGVINQLSDPLKIVGGDLDVDTALVAWGVGPNDTRAIHDGMKVKALALSHLKTVFDGDSTANPKEFDGLNARLTGGQVINAGTNGAVLTLNMLDDLVDSVAGEPSLLLMNKKTRQVIRQLARSVNALTIAKDDLGREIDLYYGVPFGIVEDDNEGNAILGFDEAQGTANNTASIYAVKFGPGAMFGAQTAPISVRDLGELDSKPAYRTRVEHYSTIVLEHPKCAARLKGVKLA